jgi:hypothetical protein
MYGHIYNYEKDWGPVIESVCTDCGHKEIYKREILNTKDKLGLTMYGEIDKAKYDKDHRRDIVNLNTEYGRDVWKAGGNKFNLVQSNRYDTQNVLNDVWRGEKKLT